LMLSGTYGQRGGEGRYFIEGARKEWSCRKCDDRDRVFFVLYRSGPRTKEIPICIPCVLKSRRQFPAALISKLDDFVVMEKLRDASREKEEGV